MDILLITNYWYPWNASGTFRWLHLSKYIDFDVLTSKKPNSGFYDETLPVPKCGRLFRFGKSLSAVVSGLYLSIVSWFIRADKYIYTCPPETLLIGAYVNGLLGRQVYVDMRDKIDRHTQPHKWLIPLYQWLYKRIKNVCVCMRFFDPEKTMIRHGYDSLTKKDGRVEIIDNRYNESYWWQMPTGYLTTRSFNYKTYCDSLSFGYGRDYSDIKFKNYNSSSLVTIRHLDNPIIGKENLHPECFEFEPESWQQIAEKMKKFLGT